MHWKIHREVSVESEVTHGALQLTNRGAKDAVYAKSEERFSVFELGNNLYRYITYLPHLSLIWWYVVSYLHMWFHIQKCTLCRSFTVFARPIQNFEICHCCIEWALSLRKNRRRLSNPKILISSQYSKSLEENCR
jgi:hypothetical protein